MAIKAYVYSVTQPNVGQGILSTNISWLDTTTNLVVDTNNFFLTFGTDLTQYTLAELISALTTIVLAESVTQGYGMTASDIVWLTPYSASASHSFANPSRSLNTAFQISTTRDSKVAYSVDIATSVSLSGGAVGTVFLEYADDSGFTSNVKEVQRYVNGNTGTLVIGLTLNQIATAPLNGVIPASKYVRLRTANTTGTPTFTFRSAQEVLL